MADTRKDKRAPVSLKVRFKSATVDEFIEQYAADISRGGVFIKSKQPMPVGTLLKFEIQLKDESPLIHGVGRVVWKREGGDVSVESPSGMGIKFIRMDPDCRVMVEKIITQRGDEPGQFESGGGDSEDEGAPAATKAAAPFFPTAGPTEAEMPRPEDRTQVRHASEFLASALAEAGSDESAREAERKAEEARRRTEEIDRARSREEQTRAAEAERERAETAEREKAARAAAEEAAAKALPTSAADTQRDGSMAKTAPVEDAKPAKAEEKKAEKAAAKPEEAKPAKAAPKAEEKKPKAEEKKAEDKKPKAAVIADRPPPLEEPQSYALPIAIGVVVVLGIIGVVWSQSQGEEPIADVAPTTEAATAPVEEIVEPPVPEIEGHGTEPEGVVPVEATAEVVPVVAPEPPPETPMAHFRVETTPPGATILIAGSERGTSPADLDLAIGTAATITARLAGYREGTQEVTPTATQRPVRIALVAMPYVIEVTTTPPGARVRAGGRTATTSADAPSRMTVSRPTAPITVGASRSGYTDGSETVLATAFQERNGEMVATVAIALTERPVTPTTTTRPPRERTGTTTTTGGTTTGGTTGTTGGTTTTPPEPEPEPEPVREPPPPREPTPEPEEAPPDNPF